MANIVSLELLDDELKAVVHAGRYKSKKEAMVHALEVLLAANPTLRVNTAVELYQRGKVTLSRAAEIAGVELEAFKEQLAEKDVPIIVDESAQDVRAGAGLIHRMRERR